MSVAIVAESVPFIDAMADVALGSSAFDAIIEPVQSAINVGTLVWSATGAIAPYIDAGTGVITIPRGIEIEKASYRIRCVGTYGTADRFVIIYVSNNVAALAIGTVPPLTLTTGLTTLAMGPYFSGENIVYQITKDDLGVAAMSGTSLVLTAAYRGLSYDVEVTVTDDAMLFATQTVHVTERGPSLDASTFLSGSAMNVIGGALLPMKTYALVYRGSRDGFSAADFHTKCDGTADILFVMQSDGGYVAAAYSSAAFTSSGGFVAAAANSCWLNNLESPAGQLSTTRYFCNYPSASIFDSASAGLTFGSGNDLVLSNACHTSPGSSCTAQSYAGSGYTGTTLFGSAYGFTIAEIEAYACT